MRDGERDVVPAARYDGYAEWYDGWRQPSVADNAMEVAELLGPGGGRCLDLGCGTGLFLDALAATGRTVIGLDRSADQARIARRRSNRVVQADGAVLPFGDGAFQTVVAMWISTDIDDFAATLAEVGRVLTPGGLFLLYGAHPCFNGPHVEWLADGVRVHPTYRTPGWHDPAPWWGPHVRARVGMRQHTLAEVLNAFVASGLAIEHVAEPGSRPVPSTLAIRARKPASPERASSAGSSLSPVMCAG